MSFVRSSLTMILGASLAACGDNGGGNHDTSPDAGMDGPAGPLQPGITILPDLERVVDVTTNGRTVLVWKQSTGALLLRRRDRRGRHEDHARHDRARHAAAARDV